MKPPGKEVLLAVAWFALMISLLFGIAFVVVRCSPEPGPNVIIIREIWETEHYANGAGVSKLVRREVIKETP